MCKHPLKGFRIGVWEKTGKPKYKIVSYSAAYVWRYKKSDTWKVAEKYYVDENGNRHEIKINSLYHNPNVEIVSDFIEVPCGLCVECRLQYSRRWAQRIMLECKDHTDNWFITLTYNDENLPGNFSGDDSLSNLHSLYPEDMTLFFKRLRKNSGQQFRYYYCGEYGDKSGRPHYHLILFGFKFDDLVEYKKTSFGTLWTSPFFEKTWGKGFCTIARCTYETAAYTSRYVMKKRKGQDKDLLIEHGILPQFVRMSRKPGVARKYFDDHYEDIYETDEIFISTYKGSQGFSPPRYFDKLYEEIDPDSYLEIKQNRKEAAQLINDLKLRQTSLDYEKMLLSEEKNTLSRIKSLKRNL